MSDAPDNPKVTEAMIAAGAHVLSEWLCDKAPLYEHTYYRPAEAAFKAMLAARKAKP